MKRSVIFVDDEPNILRGLRRMLRATRQEWNMKFTGGGEEALDIMKGERFDVVVTDMRMPGMNGAELLQRVREEHPHAVRFVLSGQSMEKVIVSSVGCAHQFLSKPCEAEILKSSINRTCELLNRVKNERIAVAISALDFLPLMTETYRGLMEWLDSEDCDIKAVYGLISNDFALASKVLQLTNSAFYGSYGQASGVKNAVEMIGPESLKMIFSEYRDDLTTINGKQESELVFQELLNHSRISSVLAGRIMESISDDAGHRDSSVIAASLRDIGILLMSQLYPDSYGTIKDNLFDGKAAITELENSKLGVNHAEVGGALMALWGFDRDVVDAVMYHHHPSASGINGIAPLTAVHIASAIVNWWGEKSQSDSGDFLDKEYLDSLGLVGKIPSWKELLGEITKEGVRS
jgi:HD-like signal output (HDOD) protein